VLEGGDGAYFVALPECMGGLASLTFLNLDMFPIMQSLPTSLAQLTELQTLVIRECPMLSVALDLVPSVTVLTVVQCKTVVLPTTCTMGDKDSLRELTVGVGQAGLQVAQVARGAGDIRAFVVHDCPSTSSAFEPVDSYIVVSNGKCGSSS